ncbi:hypothetical protein HD554DRAFT_2034985 [Boletus coccyginus]|nr:hypothetical protein HD554DRAFT_2034985 [Boletus coccyginus]
MHAPLICCKGTIKQLPALCEDAAVVKEQDQEKDEGPNPSLPQIKHHVNTSCIPLPASNLYTPYTSLGLFSDDYADPSNQASSQAHVPLMANASPFQCGEFYDDEDKDDKLFYVPSRNMFQDIDKEGLIAKEALAGEIMENKMIKIIKETSAY